MLLREAALFGPSFGRVIEPAAIADLARAIRSNRDQVLHALDQWGVVLLRGFDTGLHSFEMSTAELCTEFLTHGFPNRVGVSEDGTTQTVLTGNGFIDLHAELNHLPFPPDVLWMYCVRAPEKGGETLACDGIAFWDALDESQRSLLRTRRLKYTHSWGSEQWRGFLRVSHIADAVAKLESYPSVRVLGVAGAEEIIRFEYRVPAVKRTRFGGREAFVNSVPLTAQFRRALHLEDEEIDAELLRDVRRIAEKLSRRIAWRDGDVVLIDNSRVLHGRCAFSGERTIYTRFGQLRTDGVAAATELASP